MVNNNNWYVHQHLTPNLLHECKGCAALINVKFKWAFVIFTFQHICTVTVRLNYLLPTVLKLLCISTTWSQEEMFVHFLCITCKVNGKNVVKVFYQTVQVEWNERTIWLRAIVCNVVFQIMAHFKQQIHLHDHKHILMNSLFTVLLLKCLLSKAIIVLNSF